MTHHPVEETPAYITPGAAKAVKSVNRRFLAMFLALVLVFGLLAYRTEVNARALAEQQQLTQHAFYDACLVRQDRQNIANVGREAMVQLAAAGPNAPVDMAARELMIQRLRDALLLPVEDCGAAPQ